jgi:O-acetylhomoserine/O-acetylserine sulfhydrylase
MPVTFKKFGIGVKFVESNEAADFIPAIDDKTKAIFVEIIGNPKYNVAPIPELAKVLPEYRPFLPMTTVQLSDLIGRP